MKLFTCQNCDQLLYFENTHCERCGHALGYLWQTRELSALVALDNGDWQALADPSQRYRYCANFRYGVCTWLIPSDCPDALCFACKLNQTIPNLSNVEHLQRWQKLEYGKHRLVYALLRFGLPVINKLEDPAMGLAFDFLASMDSTKEGKVLTGHADGLITINIAEADDAERERLRQAMAEPYRTLLGHFRHEVGHYYWTWMARSESWLAEFRAYFGDEQQDYAKALETHYQQGNVSDWTTHFVSHYASAHPWEDWAETWAHYLHIVDALETAYAFGMHLRPQIKTDENLVVTVNFNAYDEQNFDQLIANWLPVTYALNSLNRSMGHIDLYPFVLSPAVLEKMKFVHQSIHTLATQQSSQG